MPTGASGNPHAGSGQLGGWLSGVGRDLQFAWRSLVRRPGVAIVAAATLGLAMGATTAVFSLFYTVLVRSLPYDNPDSLFMVRRVNVTRSGSFGVTGDEYVAWKSGQRSFTDLAASYAFTPTSLCQEERIGSEVRPSRPPRSRSSGSGPCLAATS
jgi:putative ABC transport system permease protein